MLRSLSPRGAMAATTALAGLALIVVLPQVAQPPRLDLPLETRGDFDASASAPARLGTAEEGADAAAPRSRRELNIAPADAQGKARESDLAPRAHKAAPSLAEAETDAGARAGDALSRVTGAAPETLIIAPPRADAPGYAQPDTEAFPEADVGAVQSVRDAPVSTFSIDVDTASYAVVRSSLMRGQMPPPEAVRVEEMVNYFPYDYAAPNGEGAAPFLPSVSVTQTPWNPDSRLVRIAIQGARPGADARPPLNLVFLVDTSGSMNQPDKLPLLKQSLSLLLTRLNPQDSVAIVAYAGSAGRVLAPTTADRRGEIMAALDRLAAGGSTAGQAGLQLAYATAEEMAGPGEINRVILATDGDFNVGLSDPEALKDYVASKREGGTYLSVLGFGRGNLDDATMQALAQNGNGTAAYIDTLSEAQKVLVDQAGAALVPIADDVKIQVEFNPATVSEYRLIGYETRALRREDFNNDAVDAGEIGAGHAVTALYEVTPVGAPGLLSEPLRYGDEARAEGAGDRTGELGYLKLRYKRPGEARSRLVETAIPDRVADADSEVRFAAAIAGFGQLLRGGAYLGDWGWDDAIALALSGRGEDAFGYRAEAVRLMRLAQGLSRR